MIRFEILPSSTPLAALRADWDALYRESGREPSVSYEWSRAIFRNHLADSREWFIVVLRREGKLAGIVPMMKTRERVFGKSVITLQPTQEKYNTHSDLLLADSSPELVGAWLDAIESREAGAWDLLRMSRLPEDDALTDRLARALERRGQVSARWRVEPPSFYLRLPRSYQDYLQQRSAKHRSNLKRAEKKLTSEGTVELTRVGTTGEFSDHYEELLSIERDSWKHDNGTAISAVSHQQGFYRDLAEAALESGMLHLTFVRLDGVAIAYNLGLIVGDRYFYLKTSYRQQYRAHGAANVGLSRLVQQLITEGCSILDFTGEPYEWEQHWTDDVRWHRSLLLFNGTLAGRALSLVTRARNLLRPEQEDRRIVFCDPRALRGGQPAP